MENQEFDLEFYKKIKRLVNYLMYVIYKPEIEGTENIINDSGFILAGNHKSLLDVPLLAVSVDSNIRFMAKKELFDNELGKYIFNKLGTFPVDRGNFDLKSIRLALKILKENQILGMFPEGTRNKTEEILLPFKEGTTHLSLRTKKPIIPFGISGKYKIGGGITIRFGEAIDFSKLEIENHDEYLRDKVKELIK